jgi:formamidopyrimidine-DNA glycosylase
MLRVVRTYEVARDLETVHSEANFLGNPVEEKASVAQHHGVAERCLKRKGMGEALPKRGKIKPVLLDQTVIAGLGNIYVDEVLWKIKVHPLMPAASLTPEHIQKLHTAIRETLLEAIEKLGCDFGDGVVDGGMYKPRVYGREEKKCSRCRDTIVRIVVNQRGTHICPSCQPKPRVRRSSLRHKR